MPKLKKTTETVHNVEVDDLESFIKAVTGHRFECVPNEEWSNDSQHRFAIEGALDDYERKNWELFKSTGKPELFMLRTVLEGLCVEGHIPAGTYLINVCW